MDRGARSVLAATTAPHHLPPFAGPHQPPPSGPSRTIWRGACRAVGAVAGTASVVAVTLAATLGMPGSLPTTGRPVAGALHASAASVQLASHTGALHAPASSRGAGGRTAHPSAPGGAASPNSPGGASMARPAVTTGAASAPTLTLERASWTVGPGQPYSATVAVSPRSRATGYGLAVVVYRPVHTRSALALTIAGTVTSTATYRSAVLPLASLPAPAPGQVRVAVALATPGDPSPSTVGTSVGPVHLACARTRPGTCGGVYPLSLELTAPDGAVVSRVVTEIVYAYPAGSPYHATSPLRLATVMSLGLPPSSAGAAAVGRLGRLADASVGGPAGAVPLTVVPDPSSVEQLSAVPDGSAAGHTGARAALAALDAAMSDPAHQVLVQSYVPVDPTALVDAGLQGELADQQAQACAVLAGDRPTTGAWVVGSGIDDAAATALMSSACDPVHQLVVPAGSVTGGGCSITCASPFTVTLGNGSTVTAVEADSQLGAEATAPTADPVLQAHDLVADLSLTYFEAPRSLSPRGVVLVLPPGAPVSSGEIASLLGGIGADPVLTPVTLAQYFATVPVGANGQPTSRHFDGTASALPAATVRGLRAGRADLTSLAGAVGASPAGAAALAALDDRLLTSESSQLRPPQQQQAVRAFTGALRRQLGRVSLSGGVVRLTSSSTLRVPITLASSTGYPIAGRLLVSSDKLLFTPGGSCRGVQRGPAGFNGLSCPVELSKSTNAVYVSMRARISGDFRVAVALVSPDGRLTIVRGNVTVRSLSTSVEAVVLSIAALAVLLTWWGRTSWRGRRRGRHAARSPRARGRSRAGPDGASRRAAAGARP